MTGRDQRRAVRVKVNEEFGQVDDFVAEYVTDISETGVFLRTRALVPVGTKVQLRFSVFLEDFHTIEGAGEVVRVVNGGSNSGIGVRFTDLEPHSAALLRALSDREAPPSKGDQPANA